MKRYSLAIIMTLVMISCHPVEKYKDSSLPVDERVADLLERMTLEEKAAQLDMLSAKDVIIDGSSLSEERLETFVEDMCIGAVHDLYPENAEMANRIQKCALEKSRLGIPLLFIEEGLHGYQGAGSTTFPIPLGNSCTWDTLLVNQIGRTIATEARIHGVHFILGPNLDVAHEIRWGRVEETFGEDPYLTSRMAVNIIKGMQGTDLRDKTTVCAEPKHFGVHGIPYKGLNAATVNIGEREARSTHLYTFEKAVREAGANGIMAAYHDIDGIPCAANEWLLTELLRNEWGFKGMVVSDLGAVRQLIKRHRVAEDEKDAICQALAAGLDMQFYDFPYEEFQEAIVRSVQDGSLGEEVLDQRVADVLRLKFRLGLFEDPYADDETISRLHHCRHHRDLAMKASQESIVLLKNEGVLPFKKNPERITVVGELANQALLGGYSPSQAKGVSVMEALRKRFGREVEIDYIESQVDDSFKSIPNSVFSDGKSASHGLQVEFFNNEELERPAAFQSEIPSVTAYWHNLSPAPGINRDHFSARWTGFLRVPVTGNYIFRLDADDKGKLFLDDCLLIDNWENRDCQTAEVPLTAGQMIPVKVEYAETDRNAGIKLQWKLARSVSSERLYQQVTSSAAASDLTILVLGEGSDIVGEGKDRQNLDMCERDIRLLEAVEQAGKPAATVVLNGRPFVMKPIADHSDAILEAWFPGESGGTAIVDILFGDVNPSGKLTISIPASQGQLPVHYLQKNSTRKSYADGSALPLYPFGHGLSYTQFKYSGLKFSSDSIPQDGHLTVSFNVTNTGSVPGTEICQLYLRDKIASVSLADYSLKGFSRVTLSPGETSEVKIRLNPEHFSLVNAAMQRVVEPGVFDVLVGASSSDIRLSGKVTVTSR